MAEENSSFLDNLSSFNTVDASDEMENFLNGDEPKKAVPKEEKKEPAKPTDSNTPPAPTNEEIQEEADSDLDDFLNEDEDGEKPNPPKKEKQKELEEELSEDGEDKESQTFSILSKELLDKGVFTLDEDEEELSIESESDFVDRFEYESRKLAGKALDTLFSSRGDKAKQAVQAIIIDGVDAEEYFSRTIEIDNLEEINMEDEENQKTILRQYYKKLGKKDDAIETKIQRLENIGELGDESKDAHTFLVDAKRKEFENIKTTQAAETQRKAQEKVVYQNKITEILSDKFKEKQFDGIPLDKKTLDSVSSYLLKENNSTNTGIRFSQFDKDLMDLNKPENAAKKVKVALLLQLMETDPYLTKIQKKKDAAKTSSLYNKLASSSKRTIQDSRAFSDL